MADRDCSVLLASFPELAYLIAAGHQHPLMAESDVRAFAFCPRPLALLLQPARKPIDDEPAVRAYMEADLRHRNGIG